jgi:hypothetical protein
MIDAIAAVAADELGWDASRRDREVADVEDFYER